MKKERFTAIRSFFIFVAIVGILIGGLGILCNHCNHNMITFDDTFIIPDYVAFLIGFFTIVIFSVMIWLANWLSNRKVGNGNKVSIG